jgi:hypothetical protein
MKVLGFYKGGAHVVIPGKGNMNTSFSAGGKDKSIGYTPKGSAKKLTGAASDVIKHGGREILVLAAGHKYEVETTGGTETFSVGSEHLILPLGTSKVLSVKEVSKEEAEQEGDAAE